MLYKINYDKVEWSRLCDNTHLYLSQNRPVYVQVTKIGTWWNPDEVYIDWEKRESTLSTEDEDGDDESIMNKGSIPFAYLERTIDCQEFWDAL